MATPMTINFARTEDIRQKPSGKRQDALPTRTMPISAEGKSLSPKQIRARLRRMEKNKKELVLTEQELGVLAKKPIEEWDIEELARGRTRDINGEFKGAVPRWIDMAVKEEARTRFLDVIRGKMNVASVTAVDTVMNLMGNEDIDDKGRPIVSASTKLDGAKFLIEHLIGKPKQTIESDVSVKLQGILGVVMANPGDTFNPNAEEAYTVAHFPGVTMPMGVEAMQAEDYDEDERGGE